MFSLRMQLFIMTIDVIAPPKHAHPSLSQVTSTEPPLLLKPNLIWPPIYATRVSTRAKRISVQISPKRGLEVVVPKRKRALPLSAIEAVLHEHQHWIQKHLAHWQLEQDQKQHLPFLPDRIFFPAFEKDIRLEYQPTASSQVRGKISAHCPNTLIFSGNIQNTDKVIAGLKKVLFHEAELYLIPRLRHLSLIAGLPYSTAQIRSQTTLWGSCTATHKISLNVKLLFLPKVLVDYVILHELCHTRHLNHSGRFWRLLQQFDPLCLGHRRGLRQASRYLPRWID